MNLLSIHASHDGSMTYVRNNKLIFHTQLDRYNKFKHFSFPVKKTIQIIENLEIDKILITFLRNNSLQIWLDLLNENLKNKIFWIDDKKHHLFHAYCSLTWKKNINNILIADGNGSNISDNKTEQESLFYYKDNSVKNLFTESNEIGFDYEKFTQEFFGNASLNGKTMALSLHESKAKYVQQNFEKSMLNLINEKKISNQLIFSGGCAQNVIFNSKLLKKFNKLFCDPFNGDFGISLGASNFFLNNLITNDQIYLGIPQEINTELFLKYKIINIKPIEVAKILLNDVVAIFQSRSEQGQRGLGNRSLLISPLNLKSHDKLNSIKKREWFRPFALSIQQEESNKWFNMLGLKESPYMMFVFKLLKNKRNIIKLGYGIDYSSRIQTVKKEQNLHFYNLLHAFKTITKVPILVNTSLNLPGEVLVETLNDLKELFENSNLQYIYLPEINKLIAK
jgi:predicted NodU family carbamoyl transferase